MQCPIACKASDAVARIARAGLELLITPAKRKEAGKAAGPVGSSSAAPHTKQHSHKFSRAIAEFRRVYLKRESAETLLECAPTLARPNMRSRLSKKRGRALCPDDYSSPASSEVSKCWPNPTRLWLALRPRPGPLTRSAPALLQVEELAPTPSREHTSKRSRHKVRAIWRVTLRLGQGLHAARTGPQDLAIR